MNTPSSLACLNFKPSFNLSNASSGRGKAVWATVSLAADVELTPSTSSLPSALALFESPFEGMRPRLLFFFKQHPIKNQKLLFFSSTATSIQKIMSMSDATATNAVEDAAAMPNNNGATSYIFDISQYRKTHGFAARYPLELPVPKTGLTLLRDKGSTDTRLIVRVDVDTDDSRTFRWNVNFSDDGPFKAFNREGNFYSPGGWRAAAFGHAFGIAITSIVDFTTYSHNQKPTISHVYVRYTRVWNSKHSLRQILSDVQQGIACPPSSPQWVKNMYDEVSETFIKMQKLREEGVHVMLWQRFK
ncbi:hypothetical protein FPANT_150 [Fusarium pseudoanthophilum]|uniref:Uncharacterized protein n=1 Tax=Fusarium pseudoanthophilum TaxID=48495 RepID=A0A8H5V3C1_9HYPO|nr:hypothetical protein FPANT_150 [Fusarium pseudoanthophilum]